MSIDAVFILIHVLKAHGGLYATQKYSKKYIGNFTELSGTVKFWRKIKNEINGT